jgi:hydrogenase maturation protease
MPRRTGPSQLRPLHLMRHAHPEGAGHTRGVKVLILCCGSADRGDDGAGPACADALRMLHAPAKCLPGDAFSMLDAWTGHPTVILVDAIQTGAAPGTLHRFDIKNGENVEHFEKSLGSSSHGYGIAEAFRLGKLTKNVPADAVIYGIEAASFEWGAGLSPEVHRAVQELASALAHEIAAQPESTGEHRQAMGS